MQLKEKKILMENDKRKLESELEKQRQTISKQVFLQVVQKKKPDQSSTPSEVSDIQIQSEQSKSASELNAQSTKVVNSATLKIDKDTPRRQWDKTQNFIDLENDSSLSTTTQNNQNSKSGTPLALANDQTSNTNARASSTSSLSTPSSSASQSPPLANLDRGKNSGEAVDLTKAYYSRDEMLKTIDTLKEKYVKESNEAAAIVTQAGKNLASNLSTNAGTSTSMVKDIDSLNNKLSELQNEITRLTLLQQKQNHQQHAQKLGSNVAISNEASSANKPISFNLSEQRKNVAAQPKHEINETSEEINNLNDDENIGRK